MDTIFLNGFSVELLSNKGTVEKVIHKGGNYFTYDNATRFMIRLGNNHPVRVDAHLWINNEKMGIWRINPYSNIVITKPNTSEREFILLKRIYKNKFFRSNALIKVIFKPEIVYYPEIFYNNPTHLFKVKNFKPNKNCDNTYTDTVTPHDKLGRRCELDDYDYNFSYKPLYGRSLQSTFKSSTYPDYLVNYHQKNINDYNNPDYDNRPDLNKSAITGIIGDTNYKRFKRVTPIRRINKNLITTIYARLIIDTDQVTYIRDKIGFKQGINNKIPKVMKLLHPSRPHDANKDSVFTLSRKFWFDNMEL